MIHILSNIEEGEENEKKFTIYGSSAFRAFSFRVKW